MGGEQTLPPWLDIQKAPHDRKSVRSKDACVRQLVCVGVIGCVP